MCVISEWIAWSTQLGLAPTRVVCLGPESVTVSGLSEDLPDTPGVAAVAHALGAAWPGTAVGAEVMHDPVGATMQRLLDQADEHEGEAASELEELSSRPGRSMRRMYHWVALALLAVAAVIGALGYRLYRGAADVREKSEVLRGERELTLAKVKTIAPKALTDADPIRTLKNEAEKLENALVPQVNLPVLAETVRAIKALSSVPGVRIKQFKLNGGQFTVGSLIVVELDDPAVWPAVITAMKTAPHGATYLEWLDDIQGVGSGARNYLFKGTWITPKGPATASGGPAR